MKISIAVDGPASSGKSSIASCIAERFNFRYINTGLLYRLATYLALKNNWDFDKDENLIIDVLSKSNIDAFSDYLIFNGENLSLELRSQEVDSKVSLVAKKPNIRKVINEILSDLVFENGVIMDGRDIGTEVLKDADLKFFVDADKNVRAKRRYDDAIKNEIEVDYNKILNEIEKRDNIDYTRNESPLKRASDAKTVDTSNLSFSESVDELSKDIVEYMIPKMKFKKVVVAENNGFCHGVLRAVNELDKLLNKILKRMLRLWVKLFITSKL